MSRKAFLIWGLVIIQFAATSRAILMYLALSKIIDVNPVGFVPGDIQMLAVIIGFGVILHLRFKTIGRRKRVLALCLPFFLASMFLGGFLTMGYIMSDVFGAHDRFFSAIPVWAEMEDPKPATPWTSMQKWDYILFSMPAFYLMNLGLFALLWFGSLDPRKPSKNRMVQFFKTGFQGSGKVSTTA